MSKDSRRSYLPHGQAAGGHGGDFELNLAPVIDCLTVLIVYTIISASFLSLGVFQTTVPSESSSQASVVDLQVRVDLNSNHTIELIVSGSERRTQTIAAKGDDWDFASMQEQLKQLKSRSSQLNTVTLAAQTGVQYREVVRGVEQTKQVLPNVVLGE